MTERNKRLIELMKKIGVVDEQLLQERLKKAYYEGEPLMSDSEYDELFGDKDYVGYTVDAQNSPWEVLPHEIAMGSLPKIKTWQEALDWIKDKDKVVWEPKLDGLSIELVYEGGTLVHAILRGGGDKGEDILKNAQNFEFIPKRIEGVSLSSKISVRGEVVISKSNFDKLTQISNDSYSNRRNCVPGICRRYDGKYSEFLSFWAYDIIEKIEGNIVKYKSETDKLMTLYNYNFKIPFALSEIHESEYNMYADMRDTAECYQMDGLVIKSNDMKHQIALKFEPNGETTTVTKYTWDVGSTGKVVPVIWFEPISIGGSTLTKASGASYRAVLSLNAAIGSKIKVKKMNDVIPKVTSCIQESGENLALSIPEVCPVCGERLEVIGADLYCTNKHCGAKIERQCTAVYWANPVKGITDSWIKELIKQGKIKEPADVLVVQPEDIASLDGYSINKANKIIDSLKALCVDIIENNNLHKLLYMCPIPTIAGKAYDKMVEHLGDRATFKDYLEGVKDIDWTVCLGKAKGTKANEYFADNKKQIANLLFFATNLAYVSEEVNNGGTNK